MEISLHVLNETDREDLFQFELANRSFFNTMVPDRGDDYYSFPNYAVKLSELLEEQMNGGSKFYLIKNQDLKILGRINLFDINGTTETAEVGFRVSDSYRGKGIASKALSQLIQNDLPIKQIKAKTTTVNLASQKTLEKNGFRQIRLSEEEFEMNGLQMRFIYYLKDL